MFVACCFRVKVECPTHNEVKTSRIEGEILESNNLKCFTLNEVKTATRNFHPDGLVGEGGCGSVFKGWIDDEHTLATTKPGTDFVIAVKRLYQGNNKGLSKWLTEINYLGQLHHPNLVKLIGYCFEDEHQILVYEFLTKGSLDNHLFRTYGAGVSHFQPLSWKIRMKIALDVAKGLAYLHRDEVGVIYRYFKTSKILIDSNYNAKLSVFGLEKDRSEDNTVDSEVVFIGTTVYIAPEYLSKGHLTKKIDVYSFGVVLLEVMSGKRAFDRKRPSEEQNLVEWAKPLLVGKRKISKVIDSHIQGQCSSHEVMKVARIIDQCLSERPKYRPNIDEVMRSLEQLHDSNDIVDGVGNSQSPHQTIKSSSGLGHGKSVNEPISVKGTSNLSLSVDPDHK